MCTQLIPMALHWDHSFNVDPSAFNRYSLNYQAKQLPAFFKRHLVQPLNYPLAELTELTQRLNASGFLLHPSVDVSSCHL